MTDQTPLNPDANADVARMRDMVAEAIDNPGESVHEFVNLPDLYQLLDHLAAAQPESEDERIPAWQAVANHPAFNDCYEEERPLLESMLDHLTELTAQPVVNSVEELDALPAGSLVRAGVREFYKTSYIANPWVLSYGVDRFGSSYLAKYPTEVIHRPEVGA